MAFNGIKKDRGLTTGNITLGLLCVGGGRIGLLVDDISDFGTFGVVHGEWGHFFSAIWGRRPGGIET